MTKKQITNMKRKKQHMITMDNTKQATAMYIIM